MIHKKPDEKSLAVSSKHKEQKKQKIVDTTEVVLFEKTVVSQITYVLEGDVPKGYQTESTLYFDIDGVLVASSPVTVTSIPVPPEIATSMT